MLSVCECLAAGDEPHLVLLEVLIALVGAYTAISLLREASALSGGRRRLWLAGGALAAGATIWAADFVALLAVRPEAEAGRPADILNALVAALVFTGTGFALALARPALARPALARPARAVHTAAGAVIGLGAAVTHYAGMGMPGPPGAPAWNEGLLLAGMVSGCGLASAAMIVALHRAKRGTRHLAAPLLALAFIAPNLPETGATFIRLLGEPAPNRALPTPAMIAVDIALGCLSINLLGLAALAFGRRKAIRHETRNLHDLADIAVEGLLICDGNRVAAVNRSFVQIAGYPSGVLQGQRIEALFDPSAPSPCTGLPTQNLSERVLLSSSGDRIPVEVMGKPILFAGRPHHVVAIRDLRDRRKAEEHVRFLAHHDALTGLSNRISFGHGLDHHLDAPESARQPFALLALDLDHFKAVNDTLGHAVGDLLLKRVSRRLRATVRASDLIARFGGDEFAILLSGPVTAERAATIARRVVEVIHRPYVLEGNIVNIGVSVGIAMAPRDGDGAVTLLRNADIALYQAKFAGRNTSRFFEIGMEMAIQSRRALELELRRAVALDELELFYQPLRDLRSGGIRGFEALVRWRHPERGLIQPAEFIPLAEETGLIGAIGEQVLNIAMSQAMAWKDDIRIAVNLSAMQFADGTLVETVQAALDRSGLPPRRLELEITESALLQEGAHTIASLHHLRDMGVRISMDDFGSGHSSLQYLRAFPFHGIKIDRSFVQEMLNNPECAAIVAAVIGLGRRLGISTTAEGVETDAQMAAIRNEGCDFVQGFLVGSPMPASETARYLHAGVHQAA